MRNYGDLGGCYLPRPTASTDNTLLDLHNSSQDTQPNSLIVKCIYIYYKYLYIHILQIFEMVMARKPTKKPGIPDSIIGYTIWIKGAE